MRPTGWVSRTTLGWDEASPIDTTPREALAVAAGTHTVDLAWTVGGSTPLTLVVSEGGEPAWVESVAVYPDSGTSPAIGVVCEPHLALPVSVDFSTADGAFAESWSVTMAWPQADSSEGVSFSVIEAPEAVVGTWEPDAASVPDLASYDSVEVAFDGRFVGEGPFGSVAVRGERSSGATASLETVEVARWELE